MTDPDDPPAALLSAARTLAWTLYLGRVQTIVSQQWEAWRHGHSVGKLALLGPADTDVAAINKALAHTSLEAQRAILHQALEPLMAGLDSIDNSHTKSETVKQIRVGLRSSYDALHRLKASVEESERKVSHD